MIMYTLQYWHLVYNIYIRLTHCVMHDDVIKWKHVPRYWLLCGEFAGPRWIPLTKASDAHLWCFSLIWINAGVNDRKAGDLRRHRAHYDIIVMDDVIITLQ